MTLQEIINLAFDEEIYGLNNKDTLALCKKLYRAQVELYDFIEKATEQEKEYLMEVSNSIDNKLGYLLSH